MNITEEQKVRNIILAKISMLFGFCPQCNSDAPELDNCIVCENNRNSPFNSKTKVKVWDRYKSIRLLEKYKFPFSSWKDELKKKDDFDMNIINGYLKNNIQSEYRIELEE